MIIGVDGAGGSYVQSTALPNFTALAAGGGVRYDYQNEGALVSNPPGGYGASGVNWSTITTGASAAHHGVSDNSFSGSNYAAYPHFFKYLKDKDPTLFTASIVDWAPINDEILNNAYANLEIGGVSDNTVRDAAVNLLQTGDPDAIFLHFDQVDGAGHASGWGTAAYRQAIQNVDGLVGNIMAALNARPGVIAGQEDWLVMLTADHGGQGQGHDASQGPINWNVPFIISGPSIPDGFALPRGTLRDVATTALWHMGVDPFSTHVDGTVRGLPFGPPNGIVGDVNQNGVVSGNGTGPAATDDITAFIQGWHTTGYASVTAAYGHGDLNLDRTTDLRDWMILNRLDPAMGQAVLATLAVPEPSAVSLMGLAVAGVMRLARGRRRSDLCKYPQAARWSASRAARLLSRPLVLAITIAASTAPIASAALIDNLVALYEFNGNLLDTSGSLQASHGTGVNGPQYTTGKIGTAMWLPSVRDYMSLNPATLTELDFGSTNAGDAVDFSVSMWIRQDNAVSDPAVFSNKDWTSGANTGINWAVNGNGVFDLNTKGDVGVRRDLDTAANSASLGVGVWSQVTMTIDRNGPTRLYINGANTGTIPASSLGDFNGALPWNVGQDGTGAYPVEFTGAVDELAIWRRALTGVEASQLWNGGAGVSLHGQVVEPALKLVVDRDTGAMTIQNNTGVAQALTAYEIDSAAGALNPAKWTKVAGRLDSAGNGSVDVDDRWVVLSQPGSTGDFSEGSLGDGAIPAGAQLQLGAGSWQKYYGDLADISFRYAPVAGDEPTTGLVDFVGNNGLPFDPLDLNFDGHITLGDYQAFLAGYGISLAGASPAVRHNRGDLNGDGKHSIADFLAFKKSFDELRGAGAFDALSGAGVTVPEPAAVIWAPLAALAIRLCRHRWVGCLREAH